MSEKRSKRKPAEGLGDLIQVIGGSSKQNEALKAALVKRAEAALAKPAAKQKRGI